MSYSCLINTAACLAVSVCACVCVFGGVSRCGTSPAGHNTEINYCP